MTSHLITVHLECFLSVFFWNLQRLKNGDNFPAENYPCLNFKKIKNISRTGLILTRKYYNSARDTINTTCSSIKIDGDRTVSFDINRILPVFLKEKNHFWTQSVTISLISNMKYSSNCSILQCASPILSFLFFGARCIYLGFPVWLPHINRHSW